MKSLFVRIFLSYWIAQALFMVLAIVAVSSLRPSSEIANLEAQQGRILNEAVEAYQSGGEANAWKYLRNIRDAQHVRLYIADESGRDLLGRKPPEWVERAQRGQMRTADSFWGRLHPFQFLRSSATLADGHRYVLIIELPEQHPLFGPHGVPGLGILMAIISSGLVCFVIARYLTKPVLQLRQATQKLASGDLTARADLPSSKRRDEMAGLLRDFNQMAERIETLVNAQNRLLTDISHELRSPLARLTVALELARQRSGDDARSALDRIDREVTRLNEMIQRLLTIARLEGGDQTVEKTPVNLGELIQEIAKDAAFEAQCRNCRVEVSILNECEVVGSPALLNSAIENVVRNAIRYTQEGSAVEVRLEDAQGLQFSYAVVRVTDSGPGVPEESLDKLFQPFYRLDDARGRQTGGVGLGLAITERAVRLHSGTVRAFNRPGGGLMVEIRIPMEMSLPADTLASQTDAFFSPQGKS
jgi:two-component system, OmpR family, sensor histidine kinase CpxA